MASRCFMGVIWMKYMTFRGSCAFAGVANMLERFGVDVTDRDIALGMKLPYLFAKEEGAYLGGPMLQSAQWFDLYLRTLGFAMQEKMLPCEAVPAALRERECAMIGLHLSERDKHAVICTGHADGSYCFVNNKWANTDEPERLFLTETELLDRLDQQTAMAVLVPVDVQQPDFAPLFQQTCSVLAEMKHDIAVFCQQEHQPHELIAAMNPLFRAILLDGVTMLELIGQNELAQKLIAVRDALMAAVRLNVPLVPAQHLPFQLLDESIDEYMALIPA